MASQSISGQFSEIREEVIKIAKDIARETAKEVPKDLKKAHKQIMDSFYNSYSPRRYVRTHNLGNNSPIEQGVVGSGGGFDAGLVVGSFRMNENYNISPDNVFDLMWNKAIRGLPAFGTRKLANGKNWVNPFFQTFSVSISLNGYGSSGTPHQVMEDITNHWKEAGGEAACERAKNRIVG